MTNFLWLIVITIKTLEVEISCGRIFEHLWDLDFFRQNGGLWNFIVVGFANLEKFEIV